MIKLSVNHDWRHTGFGIACLSGFLNTGLKTSISLGITSDSSVSWFGLVCCFIVIVSQHWTCWYRFWPFHTFELFNTAQLRHFGCSKWALTQRRSVSHCPFLLGVLHAATPDHIHISLWSLIMQHTCCVVAYSPVLYSVLEPSLVGVKIGYPLQNWFLLSVQGHCWPCVIGSAWV